MNKTIIVLCKIILLMLLSSCAHPYYGYTKAEWEQLTPEQQNSIKSEYDQALHYKNTMAHEDMIEGRKQDVIDWGVSKSGGY